MPIRNPFRKNANGVDINDESRRNDAANGFQQATLKPVDSKQPTEYQLSEINDSGVFLHPSPPEKRAFWQSRSNASTTSSNHRSVLSDTEPFNISRESFDSYRRSFDISGHSPIREPEGPGRAASLDSRAPHLSSRSSLSQNRPSFDRLEHTVDEGFEEVGLNDDPKPKRKSLFARFGDNSADSTANADAKSSSSTHHSFHLKGRKRGQSGQGSELKPMGRPSEQQRENVPTVTVVVDTDWRYIKRITSRTTGFAGLTSNGFRR